MPDNGICESFHKTVLDEFYRLAFGKKLYASIEDLQNDLDFTISIHRIPDLLMNVIGY